MFYEKTVLDNGITVLTEHMDGVRSAAIGLWMRVGNRDEAPETYGMSHFMEHMLFKGTPTRSALDISQSFDALGAELNAFTSREFTCYYARLMDTHLAEGFELLADMLVNSTFEQECVNTEREVVIEEIARSEDTPEDHVYDVFSDAVFPTHPLGRPVLGTRERVGSYTTADLRSYHNAHYTCGNLTVVVCGNVEHGAVVALAERWLAGLAAGERLVRPKQQEEGRKGVVAVQKDTEQAHVLYGMPAPEIGSPKRYAHGLLDAALGGGMSSRLFNEIREKRGLVYAVYTTTQSFEGAGQFMMYAGTRPENITEVLEVTRAEFAKMAQQGIERDELERVRELVCGNFVLGMETSAAHMRRLGKLAVHDRPLISIDEVIEAYRAVTVEQVNEAAAELLAQTPTVAVVSPYSQAQVEEMV